MPNPVSFRYFKTSPEIIQVAVKILGAISTKFYPSHSAQLKQSRIAAFVGDVAYLQSNKLPFYKKIGVCICLAAPSDPFYEHREDVSFESVLTYGSGLDVGLYQLLNSMTLYPCSRIIFLFSVRRFST